MNTVEHKPQGRTSTGSHWPVVMKRELAVKLRDRNFIIGTVSTIVILVVIAAIQVLVQSRTSEVTLATVGEGSQQVAGQIAGAVDQQGGSDEVVVEPQQDADAATTAVKDGSADAALIFDGESWSLVGNEEVPGVLERTAPAVVANQAFAANAEKAGVSQADLMKGSELEQTLLQPKDQAESDKKILATILGLAFGILFYMGALMFGMGMAQSVIEEKQSRVVEILVSAMPVRQLLIGKVAAATILALAQITIFVAIGLGALAFTDFSTYLGELTLPSLWFLLFFLAGFLALVCVWALAGALCTRSEDLQSTTMPLSMLLLAVFFAGMFLDGTARVIASYVPLSSTIAMPQRLLLGEAAWWEPLIALVLTLACAAVTIVLGERLYRRSVLQTGGRLTYRQAFKLKG